MDSTSEHHISKRIDDLREDNARRFGAIEGKLDAISNWMRAHPQCPNPGSCVGLSKSLDETNAQFERMELRIVAIEKWQNKLIGAGAVLIAASTIFGPTLRAALGLAS
jgi:hypothetical protein